MVPSGQRRLGGVVIIRGSQYQPSYSQLPSNGNSLACPSEPPNKKFRTPPQNAPISTRKHTSPGDGCTVEEDVWPVQAEALQCAAHHSDNPPPSDDALLPVALRPRPRSNRIVPCVARAPLHLLQHGCPRTAKVE